MRTRPLPLGVGLVLGALLLSGCTAAPRFTANDVLAEPIPAGVEFADVPASTPAAPEGDLILPNGDVLSLTDLTQDRPVVLLFFESWCGPCADQQAQLNQAAQKYAGAVTVIGVSSAGSSDQVDEYARAHDVPYPLVRDIDGRVAESFAADEAPFAVFLTEGNRLLRGWQYYPDDLAEAIDALLVESLTE